MNNRLPSPARHTSFKSMALMPIVIAAAMVAGCGDKPAAGEKATQSAARVDGTEITVHQINQILQRQQNLKPEQTEAASQQILESLIDQQLAVAKAEENKLDRDPQVVQLIEASRRAILARTYMDKDIATSVTAPTEAEVSKYYEEKPALFKNRKVYALQEFTIDAKGEEAEQLSTQLKATKDPVQFVEVLKASGVKFTANQVTQPAENLPLGIIEPLSQVGDGEGLYITGGDSFKVILVAASRSQPVSLEQAKPAIEQYLLTERRREFALNKVKSLREGAKIEYLGKFADKAPAAARDATPTTSVTPAASTGEQSVIDQGLNSLK